MIWAIKWWPNQVFAFLLALTGINIYETLQYLNGQEKIVSTLDNRKLFAFELLHSPYIKTDDQMDTKVRTRAPTIAHELQNLPVRTKFLGGKIVQSESRYPQRKCFNCQTKCRTYCKCSPGVHRYKNCFATHVVIEEMAKSSENEFILMQAHLFFINFFMYFILIFCYSMRQANLQYASSHT